MAYVVAVAGAKGLDRINITAKFPNKAASASAAKALAGFATQVEQVVILSPDKDFAQCVDGGRVVIFDRIRRALYDAAGVKTKFGVPPSAIPDLLALVGDNADGIPGIPGWGMKSAAAALTCGSGSRSSRVNSSVASRARTSPSARAAAARTNG